MNNIKYRHITLNKGHLTIATKTLWRENNEAVFQYAYAFCSPKDEFTKSVGRTIARTRFNEYNLISFTKTEELTSHSVVAKVMAHMYSVGSYPKWAATSMEPYPHY